ncbi:DUF1835 domain-containing protein [Neobacillus sp. MER 74]|uniref:DUF1835 domain-containing protein n=1 Tax=Neobacillus sp. MER 74 TaxID=2939566 RepID=UPI00203EAB24|nr:DUF1835 domain-containing protein [Neobacillus sp. MER 74]MCM3118365.1 DUF1835 domain-containing protein [Neobacillus sp. MER 74]
MIHIVNGDVVGNKIRNLPGDVLVWREMYDFGPLSHDITGENWISRRAYFFEQKLAIPAALFIQNCKDQNRFLSEIPKETEIVLWFEHDRYDQTMLMFLLNELSKNELKNLSMVTINEYDGEEPFYGLGQLASNQMEELFHKKIQPISDEQIKEAITGWKAYTSKNPAEIETWIAASKQKLPFLKQALRSHLSFFPSIHTGLNEVETFVIKNLDKNPSSFIELFHAITQKRSNDGISDLYFAAMLNELMKGPYPLLECDNPLPNYENPVPLAQLRLTSNGLDIQKSRFELIERDWWLGGVYLNKEKWLWNGKRLINKAENNKGQSFAT